MEPWVVSTGLIFLYLIATIVIGVLANRRGTANMEDFFLYGRQAGFIVLYLTVVATFHSAFAFLGSGGFFYTHGIGFWMAGTWTVLVGAITYTIGTRIWALGKKFGYITPADMLADFYESEAVRVIVAMVSVLFTLVYIQVQSAGLGYILSVATGDRISFELASAILLVVAAGYLMVGGLRAVYWTDVIQGIWMYVAVWGGSLLLTYKLFGGPVELWRRLAAERPEMLSLPGPEGFFTPGMWVGMTIALSFGIIFQPHMMIRYFTAASSRTLKLLGATTPIYLMTLFIPAAFVGLGGALILPDLATPDRVFPELLFRFAPPWLTGLILAGATAAAMSTLDSILHSNMTVLTRDVYQRYIAPDRSQRHYLAFGRWVVVGAAGGGLAADRRQPRLPGGAGDAVGRGCAAAHARGSGRLLSDRAAPHDGRRGRGGHLCRIGHALPDAGRVLSAPRRSRGGLVARRQLPGDHHRFAPDPAALEGDRREGPRRGGALRLRGLNGGKTGALDRSGTREGPEIGAQHRIHKLSHPCEPPIRSPLCPRSQTSPLQKGERPWTRIG